MHPINQTLLTVLDNQMARTRAAFDGAASHLRSAIAEHDSDDWYAVPDAPRDGKRGDEATILRFVRPLNGFTNRLGAVRTIHGLCGNPADRTR